MKDILEKRTSKQTKYSKKEQKKKNKRTENRQNVFFPFLLTFTL